MKTHTAHTLGAGLAGAAVLTAAHQSLRRFSPVAPRMDRLGMESLARLIRKSGARPPEKRTLHGLTLAGDVLGNALYYSLVGIAARHPATFWLRGATLGLAAGLGAVLLPEPMGLNPAPSNRTRRTQGMAVGLYLAGGLAAAAALHWLAFRRKRNARRHAAPVALLH